MNSSADAVSASQFPTEITTSMIRRGYLMVLGSVICNGARFHLEKAALNLGAAAILSLVFACFSAAMVLLLIGWIARATRSSFGGFEQITAKSVV